MRRFPLGVSLFLFGLGLGIGLNPFFGFWPSTLIQSAFAFYGGYLLGESFADFISKIRK